MRTEMREQAHTQQANGGGRGGGRENQKEAVLTCSHWVRYCHSDKSRYDSPFLLTCGGGRNRAVSPATRGCSSADRQHTAQVCSHSIPGGGGGQNMVAPRRLSCGRCRTLSCHLAPTCWSANTHPRTPAWRPCNALQRCTFCRCKAPDI